ncbi:uncharacterized protein V1510DRAFT_184223 [Dipodascopsis tothii]|uniref:uncharacterized protein n=1 Tax=Dipodascopsis tothii TaxID=44089 RepID=UPI0034CD6562
MKYGYVLSEYVSADCRPYSIKYNELKVTIKQVVTQMPAAQAEDAVYARLAEQFERVNVFVRSKTGELDRRVRACAKLVEDVAREDSLRTFPVSAAARRRPIIKAEKEAELICEDLQALTRFVSAHKIAFTKLVKTYNKWSESSTLAGRYALLVNAPTAFTQKDFRGTIISLSFLFDAIRRYFQNHMRFFNQVQISNLSAIDLDFEASSVLFSGSASFWVHNDNFDELQVALTKFLSLMPSEAFFRKELAHAAENRVDTATSIVYLAPTPAALLATSPAAAALAATPADVGRVIWDREIETAEALLSTPGGAMLCGKRKFIESVVSGAASRASLGQLDSLGKATVTWLDSHNAQPAVRVNTNRIRYELLGSGSAVWATLDSGVRFARVEPGASWTDPAVAATLASFPYSVLEIKWQGHEPHWLAEIRKSHTVYEVEGFNYFKHATALTSGSHENAELDWFNLLSIDIHRIPYNLRSSRKPRPKQSTFESSSGHSSSVSSSSITMAEAGDSTKEPVKLEQWPTKTKSAGKAPVRNKRVQQGSAATAVQAPRGRTLTQQPRVSIKTPPRAPRANDVRYWNEFDHPEDGEDDGGFLVSVDDSSLTLRSVLPVDRVAGWASRAARALRLARASDEDAAERESLLGPAADLEAGETAEIYEEEDSNAALTLFYTFSLALAAVIVAAFDYVAVAGDLSVTVSMLVSMGLFVAEAIALAGFVSFLWRSEFPGVAHQLAVYVSYFIILTTGVGGVLLLIF